jgi:hypothetical protein
MTRDGEVLDTIARIEYTNPMARVPNYSLIQPFPDHPIWNIDGPGRWLAIADRRVSRDPRTGSVQIVLRDLRQGTSQTFTMAYIPVPITQAMIDTILGRMPPGIPANTLKSVLAIPRFLPPIRAVLASSDGFVWVERRDGLSSTTWLRLDRRGVPVDSARVPSSYWVSDANGRQLLSVILPSEIDGLKAPLMIFSVPR